MILSEDYWNKLDGAMNRLLKEDEPTYEWRWRIQEIRRLASDLEGFAHQENWKRREKWRQEKTQ